MDTLLSLLPFLLVVPIVLSLALRALTHRQTWAYFTQAQQRPPSPTTPTVSIIVPVRGVDEQASLNFASLCQQDYSAPYELIFALETDTDPAVPVITDLIQQHPDQAIQLVYSDPLGLTAIGKIKNLIAGYRASQHDVIVLIDSDVRVAPDFLHQSVGFVAEANTGAAFAAPVAAGSADWVAALHNLAVNASVLNYGAAAYQHRNDNLVGSIIVTRRDVLTAIGGLAAIADRVVGIDVSLGQAIRAADYTIALLPEPARIHHSRDTVVQYWWQIHRWLVTIRHYYPKFPWLVVGLGLPLWWALLFLAVALATGAHGLWGLGLVGVVLGADVVSAAVINQRLVHDDCLWPFLWVALLSELISLPILIHSLFSRQVLWRGRWLAVTSIPAG